MIRSTLVLLLAVFLVAACDDPATPGPNPESGVTFTYQGGTTYAADGAPDLQDGAVAAGTFAIAFPDSVGGLVISGFQLRDGTRGDLFILQLTTARTGDFGPCGVGADCHGRLLENIDAEDLQSLDAAWEIEGGTVQVTEAGPQRVVGSFQDLTLTDGDESRAVDSGTFDLPLMSQQDGIDIMQCFLTRLTGGSCEGS